VQALVWVGEGRATAGPVKTAARSRGMRLAALS
jgi:hypothetical protein